MSLLDVVTYNGESEDFAWKFPSENLRLGTQLTVKTAQRAFFVRDGEVFDEFGPGRYTLKSNNLPLLDKLVNLPFGGESPFQAEVWFVNELSKLDNKWGTSTPIQVEDPKYGIIVPIRAFGQFGFRVDEPRIFLESLVGTLKLFTAQKVMGYFKGNLISSVSSLLVNTIDSEEVSILQIGGHLDRLSEICHKKLQEEFSKYGIELSGFQIMSVNVPEDDASVQRLKEAKDKAALLNTVGRDVYRFDKQVDVLRDAAQNEGSAGNVMGAGMGFGMGMGAGSAMGQQMNQFGKEVNSDSQESTPPPPPKQVQYYVYTGGEQRGPYRKEKILEMIQRGSIDEKTHVWKEGMDEWTQAKDVGDLSSAFQPSSPPPPSTPPPSPSS